MNYYYKCEGGLLNLKHQLDPMPNGYEEITEEEFIALSTPQEETEIPVWKQIAELKHKLAITDYQAIKYAEGLLTAEEYAPIKAQRQEWRDKINELEEQLQ